MTARKHFMNSLRALLAEPEPADPRQAARWRWLRETASKWHEAQRKMDDYLTEVVEYLDEDEFDLLCDAEQAKVDVFHKPLDDVIQKDLWPKELYFGGI